DLGQRLPTPVVRRQGRLGAVVQPARRLGAGRHGAAAHPGRQSRRAVRLLTARTVSATGYADLRFALALAPDAAAEATLGCRPLPPSIGNLNCGCRRKSSCLAL